MIFDINEGAFSTEVEEHDDFFDSIEEEVCDFDDPILGASYVGIKMESVYRTLMEATAVAELKAVQESGTEAIYEVSLDGAKDRVKKWFAAAKEAIKKIGAYIKGFFVKVFKMLESMFATNNQFVKDNGDLIKKMPSSVLKKVKFTGYKYDWATIKEDRIQYASFEFDKVALSKFINSEDAYKDVYKEFINDGKETDIPTVRRACFNQYRGESTGEAAVKKSYTVAEVYGSGAEIIDIIANKNQVLKTANNNYKDAQAAIKKSIKTVDDAEKEALDAYDGKTTKTAENAKKDIMKAASALVDTLKVMLKTQNAVHAEHVKAIKGACAQARSVAGALIAKGASIKKLGGVKESAEDFSDLVNIEF